MQIGFESRIRRISLISLIRDKVFDFCEKLVFFRGFFHFRVFRRYREASAKRSVKSITL